MQLRRLATPAVVGIAVVTMTALAASAHGYPVQHVSLNDGGIWVTDNGSADGAGAQVGRFAKPVGELDGQLTPKSATSVDVWQNGPIVAVYANGAGGGRMYAVNVDQPDFADPAGTAVSPVTPDTSGVALSVAPQAATATIAVIGTDRSLRSATLAGTGSSLDSLSPGAPALAKHLPADSVVAVGTDNTIWVAGGGELRQFTAGAAAPTVTSLPPVIQAADSLEVTTVGNVPVVADLTARQLYLPASGQTVPLRFALTGFQLQQASAASGMVVLATSTALYTVNLADGTLDQLSSGESGTAAAPVQLSGCVQAAWADGGTGSYVRTCGTPPAAGASVTFKTGDPDAQFVFRVNNGAVVLNDTADGGVFLVDAQVNNVTPTWQHGTSESQSAVQTQGKQQDQLRATPLTQGVRPGVTTEVHVLDAVKGNPALTYAVSAVGQPDQPGVTLSVSPDAQTVLAEVTTLTDDAHFQYTVDDGHGHSVTGEVTLVPRTAGENSAPSLKPGYQQPPLSVAAGGTLVIPVAGDWRDPDGDPLYIDSGSVTSSASGSSAAVTSGGALSLTAPHATVDQTVTLSYGVSDGRVARPSMATLKVSVLGSSSAKLVPPTAEPDAAQVVVGTPVTLHPLANDLPGVDPTSPLATLRLAAALAPVTGAAVSTDPASGTVTFTAQRAGDFFLSYTDAYGSAPTAKGTIRVQAVPASGTPQPPVTTPDVAVLQGQQPALVDVLADDSDPQGWLLGVTGASSATPGVHVAVIGQEWLRISADDPVAGMAATVSYTVSDGKGSAAGTVAVSAVAANPSADQITTTPAAVTVRAGDSATAPVLAGDASSTGLTVYLAGEPPAATPALNGLIVSGQENGSIRVDAPSSVTAEEETQVSYVVTDADGTSAAGQLDVTIVPAPSRAHPDQAPAPQEVDTREAAGDTAVIQIPVSGVDPDGDSVTVTGVTVPPTLGRIVSVGPDSVSYLSYPGSAGTDTFTYQVTDPYGLTGTAQVRIAVLTGGTPPPPVAVDDVISAPPGAALHWNVLANDYIAPGDTVTVEPLAKTNATLSDGVRLDKSYVYLRVPSSPADPPVQFGYADTDGGPPSLAQVVVHAVKGAEISPVANDDIAPAPSGGASTVTVNVLKNDDDPVGTSSDLKISWAGAGASADGANLTVKLSCYPRAVPYQVTAPDGLTATAVVYVQGTLSCAGSSVIAVKSGARISVRENGTVTVPLSAVLSDSRGRQLKITTTSSLTASPSRGLAVSANQTGAVTLHALGGYTGPGAVTVQVYDGATIQDKDGTVATLTVPVQVGSDAPVLRCPAAPLAVVQGGAAVSYDIGQLCHVSVDAAQAAPHYSVSWVKAAGGVSATVAGGTSLRLSAASGAVPGAAGTLKITPSGASTGGTLSVAVIKAPLPAGRPASVSVKGGQSVTVDLRQYVTSPLPQPDIAVLGVTTQSGPAATVTRSGSKVTVTPGATASGTVTLAAMVTDQAGQADRAISVAITVTVVGVPGAPGTPAATGSNGTLAVSFAAAAAHGTPVEYYTVYTNGAGHQCPASPCDIVGLANGTSYTVYVTATSSAGTGPASARVTAEPFAVPGQVTGLSTTSSDSAVVLSWVTAGGGSAVTGYDVEISPVPAGQQQITSVGLTTSHTFSGLTDGTPYTFTVRAVNPQGDGAWSAGVAGTAVGKPVLTGAPTATSAAVADPGATRAISVTFTSVPGSNNGALVTSWTVYEYKASSSAGPFGGTAVANETVPLGDCTALGNGGQCPATFTVPNDGSWYEYDVTATNSAGTSAPSALSSPAIQASQAAPDAPTAVTATASGQASTIQFSFTAGAANGATIGSVEYGINGATEAGTIAGPFTAGSSYTETLTSSTNSVIVDGTPVTVYVADCSTTGLCSSFTGPSAQVTPYEPLTPPTASATASGESITFGYGITQTDGLSETLNVCINGSCNDIFITPAGLDNNVPSGTQTVDVGYSTTGTITARLTDTAGQTASVTASATTGPAPAAPPASPSVSVSEGSSYTNGTGSCAGKTCYFTSVTATSFPANTVLQYACVSGNGPAADNGQWYGPSSAVHSGSTTSNASGGATFQTECLHALDGETVTINVTGGGQSASGTWTT
jgi:hypothetical protein